MLEGFHNVLFPPRISLGSRGGVSHRVDVVTLASGAEKRNARWAGSRRQYNAGYGITNFVDVEEIIAFFEGRQGKRFSFRWKDHFDFSSALGREEVSSVDQFLGVGDGTQSVFEFQKTYSSGPSSVERRIVLPVSQSVRVAIDEVEIQDPSGFTVDDVLGQLHFATPPPDGAQITAGFEFHVPVRFDTDEINFSLEANGADVLDIPIIEVLN